MCIRDRSGSAGRRIAGGDDDYPRQLAGRSAVRRGEPDVYKRQIKSHTRLMAKAKLPDVLRLSGLRKFCNVLNLHDFVGRIRR